MINLRSKSKIVHKYHTEKQKQIIQILTPFPKQQILDSSKLKEFADSNFKVDENGGKLSKRVESAVRKGEIARYEQFLLFP